VLPHISCTFHNIKPSRSSVPINMKYGGATVCELRVRFRLLIFVVAAAAVSDTIPPSRPSASGVADAAVRDALPLPRRC
jgi:hypothetical protein